jgi:hypothetical protein
MLGLTFFHYSELANVKGIALMRFQQQILIVQSAQSRLDNILSNVRSMVQAELLDSEIESAKELSRL